MRPQKIFTDIFSTDSILVLDNKIGIVLCCSPKIKSLLVINRIVSYSSYQ